MRHKPVTRPGLSHLVDDYDVFALDQFGVLHDGSRPYLGALRALAGLRRAGRTIIVLTNSGKRAAANRARIASMGFPAFDHIISSGEIAWHGICGGTLGAPFLSGAKAFIVGKSGDDYGFDDLGLHWARTPEAADFLLILGSDAPDRSLEDQVAQLASAAARGIPALCANPDITMLTKAGHQPAPGAIAQGYAQLGGTVRYLGKPYPDIYAEIRRLTPAVDNARILAVGDSLAHDIAGAGRFGFKTALVRTGVAMTLDDAQLEAAMKTEQAVPDYLLPALDW